MSKELEKMEFVPKKIKGEYIALDKKNIKKSYSQ